MNQWRGPERPADEQRATRTDEHPTVPTWTPAPPPAGRGRLGAGVVAALIAALLLFGGVGLYAVRQGAVTDAGASSPEAAAAGLLAALDRQDLDQAGNYLGGEERLLLATYGNRLQALLAGPIAGMQGGVDLSASNVRFRRVAGTGGPGVAVVELAGGTIGGRDARGAKLELPAEELNRRLAAETNGAVGAFRVVTVQQGDSWQVALLATLAEYARLTARGGEPDWGLLAGGDPATPGASSPEAAVRDLAGAFETDPQQAWRRLAPDERRILAAYQRSAPAGEPNPLTQLDRLAYRLEGLQTRTEAVAGQVARVRLTAGRLVRPPSGYQAPDAPRSAELQDLAPEPGTTPYVMTIQQDGTWYPSLVFTITDWMLTRAERERP
jgi:hypothetical protein